MADLYLIRHGQASFGSDDYDRLSELGLRQSRWLGEYFRRREIEFDRVICGGLRRHRQTAECICEAFASPPAIEVHRGFDEFDFQALLARYREVYPEHGALDWDNAREVYRRLRCAMLAWAEGRLSPSDRLESWSDFSRRVAEALAFARRRAQGATLVCSSGGPISMALSQWMGFGADTVVKLNLQMRNASMTHCYYTQDTICVTGFNHVPHLDTPERRSSITHS